MRRGIGVKSGTQQATRKVKTNAEAIAAINGVKSGTQQATRKGLAPEA